MIKGFLVVDCKNCGNGFTPTYAQVSSRLSAVKGNMPGEANFYCSDQCKGSCLLYRFQTKQIDPRSKLYIPKDEAEEARQCQTDHLKQLQIDECGYNYCDKCSQPADIVHLHHTYEIYKHGMGAVSSAGHMLLCPDCHIELHQECS